MNYTMELEGKLQALAVETDKLSSQLTSLNKQEGKLRASKADLEQQVWGPGWGLLFGAGC
jgi:prefoldin subunit 5